MAENGPQMAGANHIYGREDDYKRFDEFYGGAKPLSEMEK